jgi:hypothetical protein
MPQRRLPRVAPGDQPRAIDVNEPSEELDRQRLVQGPGILISESPGGTTIAVAATAPEFWAVILSGSGTSGDLGGPYAWRQRVSSGAGLTFQDGPYSGTTAVDPAYESSKNAAVPAGTVVRMWFDVGFRCWLFRARRCT